MLKVDLLMWTYNSEDFLGSVLKRIGEVIPECYVGNKIIVDGGSVDDTEYIASCFGWEFHSCKKGVPFQFRMGFELAESEYVCTFEHDIILADDWFYSVVPYLDDDRVVCVQGVRLPMDKTLRAIEQFYLDEVVDYVSLDNNIFNRRAVIELGGLNPDFSSSFDSDFQSRVRDAGFEWIVDKSVVSEHLIFDYKAYARKIYERKKLCGSEVKNFAGYNMLKFLVSPFIGAYIALRYREFSVLYGYPYWGYYKLKTALGV